MRINKSSRVLLIGIALILIVIAGYIFSKRSTNRTQEIINACIQECEKALNKGMDLSNGPCLSDDNLDWPYTDWVCDVAHNPRLPVDNKPENQCKDYLQGIAHHFVEVDPNCNYIRHY